MVAVTGRPVPPPKPSRLQPPPLPQFPQPWFDDAKLKPVANYLRAVATWAAAVGQYLDRIGQGQTNSLGGDLSRDQAVNTAIANLPSDASQILAAATLEPQIQEPEHYTDAQRIIVSEEFAGNRPEPARPVEDANLMIAAQLFGQEG